MVRAKLRPCLGSGGGGEGTWIQTRLNKCVCCMILCLIAATKALFE